ncbi:MAG TPA: hypothetical protein VFI31_28785 [Pirellulales bacterium]|nr:hypothetical protein [Pirellulales bacterium]
MAVQPRMLKFTGWFAVVAAATLTTQLGCKSLMTTVAYFVVGTNDAAEYVGLKDKRVAVVCRPLVELKWGAGGAANDLATRVGQLLRQNGKRVKVVKQSEVNKWTDDNPDMELEAIGKGVNADVVLGIDLEEFSLYLGQTLYQGKSQVKLTVCNVADGEILWEKPMRQIVWPTRGGRPTQDEPQPQFQREYIEVLATEIGNHFYPHDHFERNAELDPEG